MLILISKSIQVISTTIVTIIDPPNIVETKKEHKTNRKTIGDRKTNEPNL